MTLQLAVRLSLDKGNLAAGAGEAAQAIDGIGAAAARATVSGTKLAAEIDRSFRASGRSADAAAADIASYGNALDDLRAKYNPLFAAERSHTANLEEISRAERVGAITAAEAAAATTRARLIHEAHITTLKIADERLRTHAGGMRLNGLAAQQLSYQLNDVVVSLASGMNPLTVLIQQGSQITPIFGGIGATMAAAFSWLSPVRLGLGIVTGLIALGGKSALDFAARNREADVAARGIGRTAGTSAGEIGLIARAYAKAGDVTVDEARSIAVELTRTGRIGSEQFGRLITIAKDFGATVGTDTEAAGKQLAELFADPAKGAETLSKSLNLIDDSSARAIQRLADLGKTSEAQIALFEALAIRLIKYQDTLPWWRRMLEHPAVNAKGGESFGAAIADKAPQEKLAALVDRYRGVQKALADRRPVGPLGMDVGPWLDKAEDEMERLQRLIDRAERITAGNAASARLDRAGSIAVGLADRSPANDEATRRIALKAELANLHRGEAAPGNTAEERARIAQAIDASSRALATWITEQDRVRQLAEIDLQVAQAKDPIERAALERKRVLVQLAGQEVTEATAAATANLAYARSIAEVSAQARGTLADTLADVAARERVNALVAAGVVPLADLNRELQIEAATRQLVALAARAEGAEKEKLLRLIADTRAAITAQTEAQKRQAALQEVRSGEDRLQTLRTQIALVGQSEAVQARVLALLEAEQKIRSQGYGGAEADRMRQQAIAAADLTTTLERQKSAWEEIKSTGGDAIDTIVEGARTGADVTKQLGESLEKEALKLVVSNPLKNMLLGQNLPTFSDVGGLLGNLLGNGDKATGAALPAAVGTATITATTVIVNGGVGGLFADSTGGIGSSSTVTRAPLPALVSAANDNGGNDRIAGAFGLFDARRAFSAELADPSVRARLFAMTEAEVGGQGPFAQQAFMESTFNRASARGLTLDQALGDRRYFPTETFANAGRVMGDSRLDAKYGAIFGRVTGGSNLSNYATGNASGTVGFGGGPQTYSAGGERFGIEKADLGWWKLQQSSAAASDSISGLGTSSTSAVDALGQLQNGTADATKAMTSAGGGIAGAGQTLSTSIATTANTTQTAFGALTNGLQTGISGIVNGLGSLLSSLGGGIGGIFGSLFGFDGGGYTGSIARASIAGVVHGQEYVVNAAATARHRGLLEAINAGTDIPGYATGGYVGMPAPTAAWRGATVGPSPTVGATINQTIINNTSAQISTRDEPDGAGGRRQTILIEEAVGDAVARPRSKAQRAMNTAFGLRPRVIRR